MPPKKRTRHPKVEGTVYYLNPVDVQPTQPSYPAYNQPPNIEFQGKGLETLLQAGNSLGEPDVEITTAASTLDYMKWKEQYEFTSAIQRVFINRPAPEKYTHISKLESNIRSSSKDEQLSTEEPDTENTKEVLEPSSPLKPFNPDFPSHEITFSNSNNKEKRRQQLFDCYSTLYQYKEANRDKLYEIQKKEYEQRLNNLSIPRNPNTEISESKDIDSELFDIEQDIDEKRDFELTRLKAWRNFKRNEILKTYYDESTKVYKDANDLMIGKLEKLKQFFQRQKHLLTNLDRDFSEIGSARAEKFYSGFNIKPNSLDSQKQEQGEKETNNEVSANESGTETDTGGSSTTSRVKNSRTKTSRVTKPSHNNNTNTTNGNHNSQILSSILEGFAPLLTDREFNIVTGDEFSSRYSFSGSTQFATGDSDTDGSSTVVSTTNSKKRGVGRPTKGLSNGVDNGSSSKENTATLNKIMKQYVAPDDLKPAEIEQDLELLRKAKVE